MYLRKELQEKEELIMNKSYNYMYEKMMNMNPSMLDMQMYVRGLNKSIIFKNIPCISSGETKKMIGSINDVKTVIIVKIKKSDLEKSTYDTQNPNMPILTAPTSRIKTLIEFIHINNCKYSILTEKDSGFSFSDVVILYLERLS